MHNVSMIYAPDPLSVCRAKLFSQGIPDELRDG